MRNALPCMHKGAGEQPGVTSSLTDPRVSALTPPSCCYAPQSLRSIPRIAGRSCRVCSLLYNNNFNTFSTKENEKFH